MKPEVEKHLKKASSMALCGVLLLGVATWTSTPRALAKPAKKTPVQNAMMHESETQRRADLAMLVRTLMEEKTEVEQLAAQARAFEKMGGAANRKIAVTFRRWIKEHQAAAPTLIRLIKQHQGNPASAVVMKKPVLGDKMKMLSATHRDHVNAVNTSKERAAKTTDAAIDKAMMARVALASKHLQEMNSLH